MKLPIDEIRVGHRHRKDLGDVSSLAMSIDRSGLLHPVVVLADRTLVAGERRLAAVRSLGWSEVPVTVVEQINDALDLLLAEKDENTERKALAPSEAVAITDELKPMLRAEAKARQREHGGTAPGRKSQNTSGKFPGVSVGESRHRLAAAVGMSPPTLKKATAIVRAAQSDPAVTPIVEEMDRTGKVDAAYRTLQERTRAARLPAFLPDGVFDLIYADPPWQYATVLADNRRVENHYRTMAFDEIVAEGTRIAERCAPDAVLLLWATAPMLSRALDVIAAWGFEYRTHAIWDKGSPGPGYWFRTQHELLLVAVKGDFPTPLPELRQGSVFRFPRGRHSAKPTEFYEVIERMFPKARKIEWWARSRRPGWAAYGDEVPAVETAS